MDNNEEKHSNPTPEEKPAKSEIPLWLQGLEDQNQSNTQPTESSELNEDNWIKEEEKSPSNSDDLSSDQNLNSEQKNEAQKQNRETTHGNSNTDEVNNNSLDNQSEYVEKQISDEGFLDLSDSDLGENIEFGPSTSDEDLLPEDELPRWLMEMIDEPEAEVEPDENDDTLQFHENIDEPSETSKSLESPHTSESLEITQEIPVSEYMDDEETASFLVNEIKLEHINHESEDFSPQYDEEYLEPALTNFVDQTKIDLSLIEDSIPETSDITDEGIQEPFSDELPKTLKFAKILLDNGEFKSALDIIQSHIEETSYLDEVKKWLSESFDESEQISHKRLKTLGDIVQKRGKLLKAFAAYTQAVEEFLLNNPEYDETN